MITIKNVKAFIKYTEKINQILKNVYNSEDGFQNIWCCKNGLISMYHQKQFPSYMEVYLDSSSLVTAKGKKSKIGEELDEFIKEIASVQFSINSIKYYDFLKENKKNIEEIFISPTEIKFVAKDQQYVEIFQTQKEITTGEFIETLNASNEVITDIINKGNEPFNMILNLDTQEVEINSNIKEIESFLAVKINKKFLPYLKVPTDKDPVSFSADIFETEVENMYDIGFNIGQKIITVYSLIRVLDY